ncbi:hypothetical protein BCR32DRAFT_287325 [Anaeromyces robustus]|uniref:Uncharacterized protein n=1 Tax=Anaeromyces robustus TaxID=1754192 RepID=A0A1Y1VS42_9FUNG|nr:hypothetical protein BCR32DRAFT_287325 [Anaeromyces robustus]|eukprot:ORX64111.1 hypothetical protein BCR32DRAFT_287325 [Anaeromyces robustus]
MSSPSILKKFDAIETRLDRIQKIFTKIPEHYTFAWTFIVLLLIGRKRWKSPIGYLIILHILARDIGLLIENIGKVTPYQYPGYDYPSNGEYLWGHALSRVAYYICEVIGDWYLLIRTKALVKSNKKIKWVYLTCIIYNIAKLSKIYFNYKYIPFKDNFNPERDDFDYFLRKVEYKRNKWICDFFQHIANTIYDITVIITLKRNVFVNYNNVITHNGKTKGNFFIEKFRRLSIYRIYFTVILSLFCSPLIFLFCIKLIYALNNIDSLKNDEKVSFYKANCSDTEIENIRVNIINVNYILIYIDQILLRHYSKENKITVMHGNTNGYANNNTNDYNNNNNNNNNNNSSNSKNNHSSINYYNNEDSVISFNNNDNSVISYNSNNKKMYSFCKVYHEVNKQFEDIESQNLLNYKDKDMDKDKDKGKNKVNDDNDNDNNINFNHKMLNRSIGESSIKIKYDNNHNNRINHLNYKQQK